MIDLPAVTEETQKVSRYHKTILPCEAPLVTGISDLPPGNPELDKKYKKRVHMEQVMKMRKKQRGIPFPVPRFAAIDVNESSVNIKTRMSTRRARYDYIFDRISTSKGLNEYWVEDVKESMIKRLLFKHRTMKRLLVHVSPLLPVALLVLATISPGWLVPSLVAPGILLLVASIFFHIWLYADPLSSVPDVEMKISSHLPGLLPMDVKKKIKECDEDFDSLLIVYEPTWKLSEKLIPKPKPVPVDPVLVGRKANAYYEILTFNLTTAELSLKEFATEV